MLIEKTTNKTESQQIDERGKLEYPEKNLSEQCIEPTNSVHVIMTTSKGNQTPEAIILLVEGRITPLSLHQPCSLKGRITKLLEYQPI